MSEPTIVTSRSFIAPLLLIGAALLIIGNTTHPIDTASTATSRLDLAASHGWMPIHLTIAVGILAIVGALSLLPSAINQPRGAAFARLGAAAALAGGTALVLVFGALDGYGQAALTDAWLTSNGTNREAIETIAVTLDIIDFGMTAIGILALFGFAMAAVGAAIVASRIVGRWLGWTAVAIGVAGTVTGRFVDARLEKMVKSACDQGAVERPAGAMAAHADEAAAVRRCCPPVRVRRCRPPGRISRDRATASGAKFSSVDGADLPEEERGVDIAMALWLRVPLHHG